MFGKKSIINTGLLDLRNYSPAALEKIKLINAGTIILPSDADKGFYEAYATVKVNAGSTIKLKTEEIICTVNGFSIIDNTTVKANTVYLVNGAALVHSIPKDTHIKLIVNGAVFVDKSCEAEFLSTNGSVIKTEFDMNNSKFYSQNLQIDTKFVSYCEENCTIIVANTLTFTPDVTTKDLEIKKLHFIVGNTIKCNNSLYGYIAANSQFGNKIV